MVDAQRCSLRVSDALKQERRTTVRKGQSDTQQLPFLFSISGKDPKQVQTPPHYRKGVVVSRKGEHPSSFS